MDLHHPSRTAIVEAMPQLRTFAISLCRDRDMANELAQQTLLRAYTNLDKFKVGSNMVGWLFTILRNEYYSEYRKRRREVEDVDGIYAETLVVEPDQFAHLEFEDLRTALAELPDEMRKALILVSVDGVSYDQAAQACNCSVGTVKSRVHRARARLAARLLIDEPAEYGGHTSGPSIVVAARSSAASPLRSMQGP
jgi:RNA polymerase sigma-70 factor (ECF subfamily)